MANRYTRNMLREEAEKVNVDLAEHDVDWVYIVGGRYGHTALDGATRELAERNCTSRNVECGTPRECRDTMYRDAYHRMNKASRSN